MSTTMLTIKPPTLWRRNIADLSSLARSVTSPASSPAVLSARQVASCLSGLVALVANRWNLDTMQRSCADLVRYQPAWSSSMAKLPMQDGAVSEPVFLLAMAARGMLSICPGENVRAALAFWATESDVQVMSDVTAAR